MFDVDIVEHPEGEKVFLQRPISSNQHVEVLNLKFKVPIILHKNVLLIFDMSSSLMQKKKKLIIKTAKQCTPILAQLGFDISYVLFDNTYIKKLDSIDDILTYKKNDSQIPSMLPDYNSSNISNIYETVVKDGKYELVVFFSDESEFLSFSGPQINQITNLFREQNVGFISFSPLKDVSVAIIMKSFPKLFDLFITDYLDIDEAGKYVVMSLKNKKVKIMFDEEVVAYYNLFKLQDDIDISSMFVPPDRKIVVKIPSDIEKIGTLKIVCGDFIHKQIVYANRSVGVRSGFTSFEAFDKWTEYISYIILDNLCDEVPLEQLALYINGLLEGDQSRVVLYNGKELSLAEAIRVQNEDHDKKQKNKK